jgi:hypothetical protein
MSKRVTDIVTGIVNETVNSILSKWLSIIENPRRLVMIYSNWCSICDTTTSTNKCHTHRYDSPSSCGIYGWTYCQKCSVYEYLLQAYYYKHYTTFIRNKYTKPLRNKSFSFYRKSSDTTILPYIEHNGTYQRTDSNFICVNRDNSNIYITVCWDNLQKSVCLSNILFYNRNIFGYDYDDFPIKKIPVQMKSLLRKQYTHCNEWYTLDCIFYRYRQEYTTQPYLPIEIQKIIFTYWNNLFLL